MKNLKELVVTKYGDYQGNVSMDVQDRFAGQFESIDLPEGVIVGAGFEFGEMRGECSLDTVTVYVLVADPKYGTTMQEIIDNTPDEGVKVTKAKTNIPVSELGLFFKRFNCCGIYKGLKCVETFDI